MSTNIKPGDTIVTIQDTPTLLGHALPKGTHGTVIRSGPPIVGPYSVYARFEGDRPGDGCQVRPGDVAVVPATPAPLDPSKVKAGDTVTLESGTALVRDVVIEAKSRGVGQFVFYTAENPDPLIPGAYYLVNSGAWTLTDHQPAPEPEPEWEPGTVGTAAVKGRFGRVRVMRLHECPTDKTHHWVEESGLIPDDSHVTDVRPLVVIDPAVVDAFDLASRAVANLRDKGRTPDIDDAQTYIREALAELGLDGAS